MIGQLLQEDTIFVFGASSGVGEATARAFVDAGARVGLVARRADLLERLRAELGQACGQVADVAADACDRAQVERATDTLIDRLGPPSVVVYAIGTNLRDRALEHLSAQSWHELLDTNLTGAFHVTQYVLPTLRARGGGLLVYISSKGAKTPDRSGVAYQASKLGLVGLAQGTMAEERAYGIRTTVIFPGLIDTALVLKRPIPTPPEVLASALQPEDVAAACVFVAQLPARAHVPELLLYPTQP